MSDPIQDKMHIITAECYKRNQPINVAIIKSGKSNGFCGPEVFSAEEKKMAKNQGVVIKQQHSYTMEQTYDANTCPHCNAFIGQHYLLTEYFVPAKCGDYEYKTIHIVD